jgi:hypothetical protein
MTPAALLAEGPICRMARRLHDDPRQSKLRGSPAASDFDEVADDRAEIFREIRTAITS